jgi:hypothetical protein
VPRFVDNVDAVVSRIGTSDVGLVWGLASINWGDDSERDTFLDSITKPQTG